MTNEVEPIRTKFEALRPLGEGRIRIVERP
jgi:hypothetical protein